MTAQPFLDPQLYWIGLEVEVKGPETGGEWAVARLVEIQNDFCRAHLKERTGPYPDVTVTDALNNIRRT